MALQGAQVLFATHLVTCYYHSVTNYRISSLKNSILLVAALGLLGCSAQLSQKLPQPSGYDAIRFRQQVTVQDHAVNKVRFPAGGLFISDRQSSDGRDAYCGLAFINSSPAPLEVCIGYEAPTGIVIGLGSNLYEVKRSVPVGSITEVKVNP